MGNHFRTTKKLRSFIHAVRLRMGLERAADSLWSCILHWAGGVLDTTSKVPKADCHNLEWLCFFIASCAAVALTEVVCSRHRAILRNLAAPLPAPLPPKSDSSKLLTGVLAIVVSNCQRSNPEVCLSAATVRDAVDTRMFAATTNTKKVRDM